MTYRREFVGTAVAIAVTGCLATVSWGQRVTEESALLERLNSPDAPKSEKALVCKRLAVYGGDAAVAPLAQLLTDPELCSWARIALEAIPGEVADTALRDSLAAVRGRERIGVVNSIGVRRDTQAVEQLGRIVNSPDDAAAGAAAVSLGKIGNAEATVILTKAIASTPASLREQVTAGAILCAERLIREGQRAEAAQVCESIRAADVSEQRRREAIRLAILARGSAGIPTLVEQLRSSDRQRFYLGLQVAREIAGDGVTNALITELAEATPQRRQMVVRALGERSGDQVVPAILQVARSSGQEDARLAAVEVLGKIGDAETLPELLAIAGSASGALRSAIGAALASLPGAGVDRDVIARLANASGAARLALIDAVAGRRLAAAVPQLLELADSDDAQVRHAAITALGESVTADGLQQLIGRIKNPVADEDRDVSRLALTSASVRMADRDASVSELEAAMDSASSAVQKTLLEIIGSVGGAKALQVVSQAAQSGDDELQNTGSRLLGDWMTADVAPELLALAKSDAAGKYKIRGLRGYLRVARQMRIPLKQRIEICRNALPLVDREAEMKLILEVVERYPSVDGVALAVEAASNQAYRDIASKAAHAAADKMGKPSEVTELLKKLEN